LQCFGALMSLIVASPKELVFLVSFIFWQDIVNAICDDEDIRAVSFVGSNTVSYLKMFIFLILLYSFNFLNSLGLQSSSYK
jgi:hypothetical protein